MLEFIFGPNIPKADQYLNHISKKPQGCSPVDYGMLSKSYLVKISPKSNFIRCALGGIFNYAAFMVVGVCGRLALNEKVVNSVTLNNKEVVCNSCAQSTQKLFDLGAQFCKFLEKIYFPPSPECAMLTGELKTGNYLLGLTIITSTPKILADSADGTEKKCYEFVHSEKQSLPSKPDDFEECRKAHFTAATLEGIETFAVPFAVCALLFSLYSFVSTEVSRSTIETQIISKLKERYQMAADKLALEFDEAKGNPLLLNELEDKAKSILKNKVYMFQDIETLHLPSLLIHENKLAIINPVLDVCKTILQ